jgi:hypothetical protein
MLIIGIKEESPYKPESVEEFRRIDTLGSWPQKIRFEKLLGTAH